MSSWNEEEIGNIIWGEASEADVHTVPYPKGNEEKPLLTDDDHSEQQYMQDAAMHVKLADQTVSGANSSFSTFKVDSSSLCNPNEAPPSPGTEIDSWPETPLINVADGGVRNSVDTRVPDLGNCTTKYNLARAAQLDDGLGLFGNEFEVKDEPAFLDYSWDNIESFDDLDIFRNEEPLFGPESPRDGELWSAAADLFTTPTKSFPTCSPNSGVDASLMSQQEVKPKFVQPEDLSCIPGFGGSDHLSSVTNDTGAGKDCFHFADPCFECIGESKKILLEKKVNENEELLKGPPKDETESSVQDLHPSWTPSTYQFQPSGSQVATSSTNSSSSSVNSQKQPLQPELSSDNQTMEFEPSLYWQTSHLYSDIQHQYPLISPLPTVQLDREKHQRMFDYGNSQGVLNHANLQEVFPAPSIPPSLIPEEKTQELMHPQQMKAVYAIRGKHQFDHNTPYSELCTAEKSSQENQHQDTEGSTIDAEENLKTVASMELDSPMEQNDSHTVPMVIDDCSLQEKELKRLQDVIEKLDIKVRLRIRDSLFRLAQSAKQKHKQSDGIVGNIGSYDHDRLARMQDVEKETNPVDRIIAHMLFHPPLQSSSAETPSSGVQLIEKPYSSSIKSVSAGCVSDSSIDKQSLSQQSCTGFDKHINNPGKTYNDS